MNKHLDNIQNNPKEIRSAEFRISEESTDEVMILEGYALKFNSETLIGSEDYGFREVIDSKALDSADMKKVPLKYNHSDNYIAIASTKNNSLELKVDKVGLKFRATLIPTQNNKDIYMAVKEKLITECSFGFILAGNGSEWDFKSKPPIRTIKKIDRLFDISLVDIPAYQDTSVSARSLELFENEKKAVEAEKEQKRNIQIQMEMKLKLGGFHEE